MKVIHKLKVERYNVDKIREFPLEDREKYRVIWRDYMEKRRSYERRVFLEALKEKDYYYKLRTKEKTRRLRNGNKRISRV